MPDRALIDRRALGDRRRRRISACGRSPLHFRRTDGSASTSIYRCGDRYCPDCADDYGRRIFACILRALRSVEVDEVYEVTLTARSYPGHSHWGLEAALSRDRDQWAHTAARCRLQSARHRRGQIGAMVRRGIRPARMAGSEVEGSLLLDDEGRRGGLWPGQASTVDYIWTLEITKGDVGWHVHRHVICADLTTARQIAGAWDSYRSAIQGDTPHRVAIHRRDALDAADYAAGHVGGRKPGGWHGVSQSLSYAESMAWLRSTKGRRRYDAAGAFRPLGVSRRCQADDEDGPTIAIASTTRASSSPQDVFARLAVEHCPPVEPCTDPPVAPSPRPCVVAAGGGPMISGRQCRASKWPEYLRGEGAVGHFDGSQRRSGRHRVPDYAVSPTGAARRWAPWGSGGQLVEYVDRLCDTGPPDRGRGPSCNAIQQTVGRCSVQRRCQTTIERCQGDRAPPDRPRCADDDTATAITGPRHWHRPIPVHLLEWAADNPDELEKLPHLHASKD